jgi:hypothetical protein
VFLSVVDVVAALMGAVPALILLPRRACSVNAQGEGESLSPDTRLQAPEHWEMPDVARREIGPELFGSRRDDKVGGADVRMIFLHLRPQLPGSPRNRFVKRDPMKLPEETLHGHPLSASQRGDHLNRGDLAACRHVLEPSDIVNGGRGAHEECQ